MYFTERFPMDNNLSMKDQMIFMLREDVKENYFLQSIVLFFYFFFSVNWQEFNMLHKQYTTNNKTKIAISTIITH